MPKQRSIIDAVNLVLKRHDNLILLNNDGVCAGLACIYVRYNLDGKKEEFFKLARDLANLPPSYELGQDPKLDQFIQEIEHEYNINQYTKGQFKQGNLQGRIFLNGKPIKKEFALGLIQDSANWTDIFRQIKNEGRTCYVESNKHAIAVSFVNGVYEIYDPNYDLDKDGPSNTEQLNMRYFTEAQDVVKELVHQFNYEGNEIGLGLIVYAHPDEKTPAHYPDKKQILENCYKTDNDFKQNRDSESYNAFDFAIERGDIETLEYYYLNKKLKLLDGAKLMLNKDYNTLALKFYQDSTDVEKRALIEAAVVLGNDELVSTMLTDYKTYHLQTSAEQQVFKAELESFSLLKAAAMSLNLNCLLEVLAVYQGQGISLTSMSSQDLKECISNLAEKGDAHLGTVFAQQYPNLPREIILLAIQVAATHNKQSSLHFWLQQLPKENSGNNQTLIDKSLIQQVSLIHFITLLKNNFSVDPKLLPEVLKKEEKKFFELAIEQHGCENLKQFLNTLLNIEEFHNYSLDLFKEIDGLPVLTLLISYKQNELIKANWPARLAQQAGNDALAYAIETNNQEMVLFLTKKGYTVSTEFQRQQLEKALSVRDNNHIETILASSINPAEFYIDENKELIKNLIKAGHNQFFIDYRDMTIAIRDEVIHDYLWTALTYNNNGFIQFISQSNAEVTDNFLLALLTSPKPNYFANTIRLANAINPETLQELFNEVTTAYNNSFANRDTKEDFEADLLFCKENRKKIRDLVNLLTYALEKHHYDFAEKLRPYLALNFEELYALFLSAAKDNNVDTIEYLLKNYSQTINKDNKSIYNCLMEAKQYDYLLLIIRQQKTLDAAIANSLLKDVVKVKNESLIQALVPFSKAPHRVEGSAMYSALSDKNIEGAMLLLQNNADISEYPLPKMLFSVAIKEDNDRLLSQAFNNPQFQQFFKSNLENNLNLLFKSASSANLLFALTQIDLQTHYDQFLEQAILRDDLALFNRLKQESPFATYSKEVLFKTSCHHQAIKIANDLLLHREEFTINDYHPLLNQLWDVNDNEERVLNDNGIRQKVYQNTLSRLYELMLTIRYRNFPTGRHQSIYEFVFDLKKPSLLRNRLIQRALDEDEPELLAAFLNELKEKPALAEHLAIFAMNLEKPRVIKVLLDYYSLDAVIAEAITQQDWAVVVGLLKDKNLDELSPENLNALKLKDREIMQTLAHDAKARLNQDPRHQLNDLLKRNCSRALAAVLVNKQEEIEILITEIQDLMLAQQIDLRRHFYRFDLRREINEKNELINQLENKVAALLDPMPSVQEESTRQQLRAIKAILDQEVISVEVLANGNQLTAAFNDLADYEEATGKLKVMKKKLMPSTSTAVERLIKELEVYRAIRSTEDITHHKWLPIFFQFTRKQKIDTVDKFILSLSDSSVVLTKKDRAILKNSRLFKEYLNPFLTENNKKELQAELGLTDPITSLDKLIDALNARGDGPGRTPVVFEQNV